MTVCDMRICRCICAVCVSGSSCYVGASFAVKLKLCAGGNDRRGVVTSEHGIDSQLRLGCIQRQAYENRSPKRQLVYYSQVEKPCHSLVTLALHCSWYCVS